MISWLAVCMDSYCMINYVNKWVEHLDSPQYHLTASTTMVHTLHGKTLAVHTKYGIP